MRVSRPGARARQGAGPTGAGRAQPYRRAVVLAAGLGLRMRPLSEHVPKPLIPVAGKAMLDHALDHLAAAGVSECVVNVHYKGAMIASHLEGRRRPRVRPRIKIQVGRVPEPLETGGGVKWALPRLGRGRFFVVNADILWRDGSDSALARLARAWDTKRMDALLLLQAKEKAVGYEGSGDYFLGPGGDLSRRGEEQSAPLVFAGVQLLHPRLFKGAPDGPFSLVLVYDRAQANGRLFGLVHDGEWFHIGTPEGLKRAEKLLRAGAGAEGAERAKECTRRRRAARPWMTRPPSTPSRRTCPSSTPWRRGCSRD